MLTLMAEPAAGIAPTRTPETAPRMTIGHMRRISLHGGKIRVIFLITSNFGEATSILLSTSANPKMPTTTGITSRPPCRFAEPKSKRDTSVIWSKPTMASSSPTPAR